MLNYAFDSLIKIRDRLSNKSYNISTCKILPNIIIIVDSTLDGMLLLLDEDGLLHATYPFKANF